MSKEPFTILIDHTNLQYWKAPKDLNQWTAQWHADLQEYDYKIKHILGKVNTPVDALPQPPNADQGEWDNENVTVIPPHKFVNLAIFNAIFNDNDTPLLLPKLSKEQK